VAAIAKLLAKLQDAAIRRKVVKDWQGKKITLSAGLIELVLKGFTAYRMQLFLYSKASGAAAIGSSDCWFGVPAKAKKAATA
jgi:hypothetical protein